MTTKLTQRLIGAVVLIAIAVIFVPSFFKDKDNAGKTVTTTEIPVRPPQPQFQMPDNNQATNQQSVNSVPEFQSAPVSSVSSPVPTQPSKTASAPAKPAATVAPSKPVKSATSSTKPSVPTGAAWVVQMGSFSKTANASALQEKLRKAGFTAYTRQAKTSTGTVNRVFVGPFVARTKADSMVAQLQQSLKLKGVVVSYEPLKS